MSVTRATERGVRSTQDDVLSLSPGSPAGSGSAAPAIRPSGRRLLGGSKALPRSPLRLPAAAAALVAAAAHVPVIPDHLQEAPYIGWLFVGLSVLCVLGAIALLVDDSVAVWAVLGAGCAAAVLGYLFSRGPGLPAMADDVGDWANPLGMISVATEALVAGLAVWVVRSRVGTAAVAGAGAGAGVLRRARARRWAWAAVPVVGACLALAVYPLGLVAG